MAVVLAVSKQEVNDASLRAMSLLIIEDVWFRAAFTPDFLRVLSDDVCSPQLVLHGVEKYIDIIFVFLNSLSS